MKSNILGYKEEDKNIFFLDRPSSESFQYPPYVVIRIYGEENNLISLNERIKIHEVFTEDTLINLNLKFREVH